MKSAISFLMGMSLVAAACGTLHAQGDYEKINAHLGVAISVPLNPTANYVHTGWGVVGGAGYNFSSHHSVIGEFMWNRFHATDGALQPLRETSQTRDIDGHSNLYALTGNYRYELRGKVFGTYFIGGGGLYYRITNLSTRVNSGSGTTCAPAWVWWGFNCVLGTVMTNQEIGSASSTAFGVNGGLGFTARVGEAPYRLYVESRYHYAPNKNISTQLATVSVGIRY
jgi:outer membrane protein with beta-barrel domain